ncbi:MAG: AAA family ATPase [Sulfuritalea sp.]|jgi:replication-associated recombination protein RarA|nr:AAA family ATPase [Sulfuritalea sp.]
MSLIVPKPIMPDDFVLMAQTKHKLHLVLDGTINFPGNGVSGLVLYGIYGTGKTTMASLLPGWIETAKSTNFLGNNLVGKLVDQTGPYFSFQACAQGQNGSSVISNIINGTSLISLNSTGLHYVILDEVDILTTAAIASLKSIMNQKNIVFILTTNNLNKIDKGVMNRSILLDMNAAPTNEWINKIIDIYQTSGLKPPLPSKIAGVVLAGNGSARSIFTDIEFAESLRAIKEGDQS